MDKNLKDFNGIKGTEDNLTGIAKANFNTEHGIRNLVLWGKEVDENSYLSLGILKRFHKYYGTDNSEIKFEKVLSDRFDEEVFNKNNANLVLVVNSINDLIRLECNKSKEDEENLNLIIKRFVRLIEIAHKNRARIIFTTISPFSGENKNLEYIRNEINSWIRNSTFLDGYLDLDKIVEKRLGVSKYKKEINYDKELEEYMAENISLDYIVERLKPFELDHMSQSDLIKAMNENSRFITEDGVNILVKPIPDPVKGTRIDRRIKYFDEYKRPKKSGNPYIFAGEAVGDMRDNMGLLNLNLCKSNILMSKENINGVNCRVYKKEGLKENLPCIVYIHGGAFIGGSLDVSENPCKLIAEGINGIVISVDYSLAPEKPYPLGLNDCRKVVEYIEENNFLYGIDKSKIGIVGESAGANLATIVANENSNIKFQGLVYPVVTFVDKNPFFNWDIDLYENPYNEEKIYNFINSLRNCEDLVQRLYIQRELDPRREDLSPIFNKNLSKAKKTLIAVSEYDYLRVQGEAYGKLIHKAGVETKIIRYEGVNHAFLDNLGIYPQAEDTINEIVKEFLDAIGNKF
ncbi:TPA: alpha/beta hydrolase fold domain-containing protein [Clostridium perfringens]|uniref:alpha/beta hydrolase fold domain-containing protein n=1 Tax=Clostridium perfringens TaxID=1502 RepID=UPI0018A97857|nr:alpha/beta hydrolase fold domain-containing protein [Clostridium perfringens]EHR1327152.1 alpha/beta hydrolase fold domain-containing protein [Clostridium perfringens]EHR1330285.1 alpha/beta hydrolase fold domain-containing protein [Clostridium perfringens]EHR1423762.1 alpha/beta hydrolase fold domain-containing protein [Clostridium perfringens]EIF6164320.1 alpha/beta hydrolase fold domain-containing protein [Clostridium perfringens]MDK0934075.1 alpha/beta hydrolase fold domain-containing p